MQQKTNACGVMSLTFSLISLFFMCCFGIGLIFALPAFVLGIVGVTRKNMETGTAIAGIILSVLGGIMSALALLYYIVAGGVLASV